MKVVVASLMLAVFALAVWKWRSYGLYACVVIGFLQDPIRKLFPGSPVALTTLVVAAFAACLLGALREGEQSRLAETFRWFPRLRAPVAAFVVIVLAQSTLTFLRTRSPVLAGLGVLSYLSPVVAIVVGQRAFLSEHALKRWLTFYVYAALAVCVSILLQFSGVQSGLFRSIGLDSVYGVGGRIGMMCGVMRSSEIAAWHLGIGASIVLALSVSASVRRVQLLWLSSALVLIVGVFLTGRRKMLAEFLLFLLCYAVLLVRYRRGASRLVRIVSGAAALAVLASSYLVLTGQDATLVPYLDRGFSVVTDSGARFSSMTYAQFASVVADNGFFGAGAGTSAQGSQYYGGGYALVGGGAEGGAAKVLAELGVPGALAALWLAVALAQSVVQTARLGRRCRADVARLFYGIAALFPANAAVFVTAHQVFGDPFVVILLGLFVGSVLALPRHVFVASSTAQTQTAPAALSVAARA